uniref:Uncharacterized protein n=2 Tax=Clastoptera arizonana TaxID=38151 RepID=A0A1B6EBV8_9HEMI
MYVCFKIHNLSKKLLLALINLIKTFFRLKMPPEFTYEVDPETGVKIETDSGSGEVACASSLTRYSFYGDSETGERNQNLHAIPKHVFKVPRSYLKVKKKYISTAMCETPRSSHNNSWVHNININTLFILPLMVILPGWFTVIYVLAEGIFHLWAHKNNYTHYKSPFEPVFEQACAICSFQRSMDKVGKLQDERLIQVTTRRLLDYNYVKKIGLGT